MKIHIVTEIPGPYRNPHFFELERQLAEKGHHLKVHFMAETDDIRPASWFDKGRISFTHQFHKTRILRVGRRKIYWNPGIIHDVIKEKPNIIITGGLWSSLTCLCLILFWPKKRLIGWAELNENVLGVSNPLTNWIRRRLLLKPIALALPGVSAEYYLQKTLGINRQGINVIPFPNLIDEVIFNADNARQHDLLAELGLTIDCRIALWPARLEEEKGIEEFLQLLEQELLAGWKIVLIGEGSKRQSIEQILRTKELESTVEIRPYVSPETMSHYYSVADLLLLPSLRDPNPLSVIESLRMGIPMLLSDAVGNHYEALTNDNGWLLPLKLSTTEKKQILNSVFSQTSVQLQEMGRRGREVYREKWQVAPSCARTISAILSLQR